MGKSIVIYWIIALVALIIIAGSLFSGKGGFNAIKETVENIKNSPLVPEITIGAETIPDQQLVLSTAAQQQVDSLRNAITAMSGKKDCFMKYDVITALEEKQKIWFIPSTTNPAEFIVTVKHKDGRDMARYTLIQFSPCVIAGGNVASNFYDNFFNAAYYERKKVNGVVIVQQPYYTPIYQLQLENNRILYDDDNGRKDSNVAQGWLYATPESSVCFFPVDSYWFGKAGAKGLDISITNNFPNAGLPMC